MNCKDRKRRSRCAGCGAGEPLRKLAMHVQSCEGCRTFCAQQGQLFRAMDTGLRAMANEPAPPSLLPGVRARMLEKPVARRPWFLAAFCQSLRSPS